MRIVFLLIRPVRSSSPGGREIEPELSGLVRVHVRWQGSCPVKNGIRVSISQRQPACDTEVLASCPTRCRCSRRLRCSSPLSKQETGTRKEVKQRKKNVSYTCPTLAAKIQSKTMWRWRHFHSHRNAFQRLATLCCTRLCTAKDVIKLSI